jgi:hypothetical protein
MKKLIDTATNTTICEIVSNHSMTLDEAIECAGGEILNATEDNVIIDGVTYCYDDLDLVYSPDTITPVAHWANAQPSNDMPIYNIGGVLYCADGWNGEAYLHSFRVLNAYALDTEHPQEVELWPVYRFEAENRDFDEGDDTAAEIVGFAIR